MASQLISILKQGIWASLTGGWFFDKRQSHFSNLFHLYIWLFLWCLPLTIETFIKSYIKDSNHIFLWIFYCIIIAFIFVTIKLVNAYLHHLFDTGECVIEEDEENLEEVPQELAQKDNNQQQESNVNTACTANQDGINVVDTVCLEESQDFSIGLVESLKKKEDDTEPMIEMNSLKCLNLPQSSLDNEKGLKEKMLESKKDEVKLEEIKEKDKRLRKREECQDNNQEDKREESKNKDVNDEVKSKFIDKQSNITASGSAEKAKADWDSSSSESVVVLENPSNILLSVRQNPGRSSSITFPATEDVNNCSLSLTHLNLPAPSANCICCDSIPCKLIHLFLSSV